MNDTTIAITVTALVAVSLYVSIRGLIQLFQRHSSILVIFYIVLLSPIAVIHGLILGIFGKSKKKRDQEDVERLAKIQVAANEMAAEKTEK